MAWAATLFLFASVVLAVVSVARGRAVARVLATNYRQTWEAMGRPVPGFFPSMGRLRFAQFILGREYEPLGDPALTRECELLRRLDLAMLVCMIVGFAGLALALGALDRRS